MDTVSMWVCYCFKLNHFLCFLGLSKLQECGPYVALKHWLQRSDVPLPPVRDAPMPSAERAIHAARKAIETADAAGAAWLQDGEK